MRRKADCDKVALVVPRTGTGRRATLPTVSACPFQRSGRRSAFGFWQVTAGRASFAGAEHAAVIRALGKRVVGDIIEIGRLSPTARPSLATASGCRGCIASLGGTNERRRTTLAPITLPS